MKGLGVVVALGGHWEVPRVSWGGLGWWHFAAAGSLIGWACAQTRKREQRVRMASLTAAARESWSAVSGRCVERAGKAL